jgi:hypothetical protein
MHPSRCFSGGPPWLGGRGRWPPASRPLLLVLVVPARRCRVALVRVEEAARHQRSWQLRPGLQVHRVDTLVMRHGRLQPRLALQTRASRWEAKTTLLSKGEAKTMLLKKGEAKDHGYSASPCSQAISPDPCSANVRVSSGEERRWSIWWT